MPSPNEQKGELAPLTIIRTETALSRYPVHRLSKVGNITIEIRKKDENGVTSLLWEVSHNSKFGQPGPLAYRLDTLLINRRIEEGGRPVPKILRLGSLRDICREMGMSEGENTQTIRRALRQNAGTFISARITFRDTTGGERNLEADFNRYTVIFNGETLPDGRRADSVYLLLNDVYMEVLNAAIFRPLDYDYLKQLSPGAQRFYEILSYQIYAALRHNLPRARLAYSEYCTYSTQVRYFDYEHVKKQLYKIHRPHLRSEYLARVDLEATTDEEGRPDWLMYYTPGAKARAEFQAFMQRRQPHKMQGQLFPEAEAAAEEQEILSLLDDILEEAPEEAPEPDGAPSPSAEALALIEELVASDVNREDAVRLVEQRPDECRRQLSFLPFVTEFRSSRGAYLRSAIEKGFGPPKGYEEAREREDARRRQEDKAAREKARQRHQDAHTGDYLAYLASQAAELEVRHPDAYRGFVDADAARRQAHVRLAKGKLGQKLLEDFDQKEEYLHRLAEYFREHSECPLLTFWQWDTQMNPQPLAAAASGEGLQGVRSRG